jgi:hypothetical protein
MSEQFALPLDFILFAVALGFVERFLKWCGASQRVVGAIVGVPVVALILYGVVIAPAVEFVAVTYFAITGNYLF